MEDQAAILDWGLENEITCYVIDANTLSNLILRRPWIHSKMVDPSTLHKCIKYVDEDGDVRTLIGESNNPRGSKITLPTPSCMQESVEVALPH